MIKIFGLEFPSPGFLQFLDPRVSSFIATAIFWFFVALVVYVGLTYTLRTYTRRLPGEVEEIVLGILRKPLIFLTVAFGTFNSLEILPLRAGVVVLLERLFNTALVFVTVYLLWRLIKDILVYYGTDWARRTESRVDDVLIPILNLFGPLIIIINGGLIIFPIWGINVTSVLLGAGVVGLVLGLALQDSLSNIFSGISLLVEAPFRTGDLIVLPDGRICEVERLGMRSTQLYSLDDHAIIYMPNRVLATIMIVNITKPTVEQKASLEIAIGADQNMAYMQEALKRIASSHPNVLLDDLSEKNCLLQERIQTLRKRAANFTKEPLVNMLLLSEAQKSEQFIHKLDLEKELNQQLKLFELSLQNLIEGIRGRETGGITEAELEQIKTGYLLPVEEHLHKVVKSAQTWTSVSDPWGSPEEQLAETMIWETRNERLVTKWKHLHGQITRPVERLELRLDDLTRSLLDWLKQEYKLLPQAWKNPQVVFKGFDGTNVKLQLWFYVDNIRMEHFGRSRRVLSEVARNIREQFIEAEIESV
jgi:MscS family membrane protein